MMIVEVSALVSDEQGCLCSSSLCSGKQAAGKVTMTSGIIHYFCSTSCFEHLVGKHPEKRFVTRFQPDQGTPLFPSGAPQREEYNFDSAYWLAVKQYEGQWMSLYTCRDSRLSPDGCGDPGCPLCGSIEVGEAPPGQEKKVTLKLTGTLIKAGEPTADGRVFTEAVIKAMLASAGPQVTEKKLVGTFAQDGWRPDKLDLRDIALLVTDLFTEDEGRELHAEVETLETPKGFDAVHANELIAEARKERKELGSLVLKPRGTGTVAEDGTIGEDFVLESVDLCWEQIPIGISTKTEEPDHSE